MIRLRNACITHRLTSEQKTRCTRLLGGLGHSKNAAITERMNSIANCDNSQKAAEPLIDAVVSAEHPPTNIATKDARTTEPERC